MAPRSLLTDRHWPTLEPISNAADARSSDIAADGETATIAAAKSGSRAAVETLVRRHYDQCYALCRRLTCDDDQALDAAQEAMIAVARDLSAFDERGELSTWIYRVTTDAIFAGTSRRGGTAKRGTPTAGGFERGASSSPAPSLHAGRPGEREPGFDLDGALGEVVEEQRTAVVLRDMLGLEYSAIGQVMLQPLGAVARLVAGGRLSLLATLELAKGASAAAPSALGELGVLPSPSAGPGPGGSEHPGAVELSVFLDGMSPSERAQTLRSHVESCKACERHLDRLRAARGAISASGLPLAPRGARDRAVVAAAFVTSLSSVAKVARDITYPPGRPAPQERFSTTGSPGTASSGMSASSTSDSALNGDLPHMVRRPPPRRTGRGAARTRRVGALVVLGAVMVAGLGGGLLATIGQGRTTQSSAAASGKRAGHQGSHAPPSSPTTRLRAVAQQTSGPAIGALVLQLRPQMGAAGCGKALRRLESINGVFAVLDPPPSKAAVVDSPPIGGATAGCIRLGPSLAALWSGDIEHLAVEISPVNPTPTKVGSTVAVVIEATSSAVTRPSDLKRAEHARRLIDVVAEGADVGTADIGRGSRITLHVTRSMAAFVLRHLSPSLPSAKS